MTGYVPMLTLHRARKHATIGLRPFLTGLEPRTTPSTFTVANLADNGPGSLRLAISNANAQPGSDTIDFFPGLSGTIALTTGELSVSDSVVISGPGSGVITVSGGGASRVFNTQAAPAMSAISVLHLTLSGGKANSGGAIFVGDEALTVDDCVLSGNKATVDGGAVYAFLPLSSITIQRSTIANNSAGGSDGGIAMHGNAAPLTVISSTITGNTSGNFAGGIGTGGGNLLLLNSTVSGNYASNLGGGLFLTANNAPNGLVIRNSTIANNTSAVSGGGIMVQGYSTLLIQNSTVTGNSAANGAGGIAQTYHDCTLNVESSIIAGNVNSTSPDVAITTVNAKATAIGSKAGIGIYNDQGGNLPFGTDLKLGPLANNGGLTQTCALLSASPCVNAGTNPAALAADQRGAGFARLVGKAPDIGAYERQAIPPELANVVINGGAVQRSRVTSVTVNFDSIVSLPATPADAIRLQRQGDGKIVGLTASVTNTTTTSVTLTFSGALSESGSLQDGRYTLTVFGASVSNANGSFDGNADGVGGDDYTLVSSTNTGVFRLFGDSDGDAAVSATDFGALRAAFGNASNFAFDSDGDGDVDATDFGAFRQRYGTFLA